jgi:hypothetical protein
MDRQPVPLANRQQQLSGSIKPSTSSTRQAPVSRLHLGGSPEIAWREALQPYAQLRSLLAQANNKGLLLRQAQLRQRADSCLAPTRPFTSYVCIPVPAPCLTRSPPALPASSPPPPICRACVSCSTSPLPWKSGPSPRTLPSRTYPDSP